MGTSSVLLATAMVPVKSGHGRAYRQVMALLHSDSQQTLMTSRCASKLGLLQKPAHMQISGVGRSTTPAASAAEVGLPKPDGSMIVTNATILQKVTDQLPAQPVDRSQMATVRYLQLADPAFDPTAPVDMKTSS